MARLPTGPPAVLAISQLINSVGDGAYFVCSALYFTQVVGLSVTEVGIGLTLGWGLGTLAGVPLGHLADRRGPRGTAILLALGTCLSIASFLVISSFPAFVVSACCYALFQSGLQSVRQALLAALVEYARRTRVRAHLQVATNAGLSLGAIGGAVALSLGTSAAYHVVFAVDAASFLISALVLFAAPAVAPQPLTEGQHHLAVLRDRPYTVLAALNMIMLLRMPIISVATPLWIVQRTNAPHWMVAVLLAINTGAVMLFQVRVARPVVDLGSAARLVRDSGWPLLAACVAFLCSGLRWGGAAAVALLVLAAGLLVLGEMMQTAGAWELSFELAPAHQQGQYQGFFTSGTAVARTLGPLVLTTLVIDWGSAGWFVLGGLFLASALATPAATRWARRSRPVTAGTGTAPVAR